MSVTVTSRTELTSTDTSALADANPGAVTSIRYAPGDKSSTRNSPRSSVRASRRIVEVPDRTRILACGMRAPVVSWTVPRSDPRGFCAAKKPVRARAIAGQINALAAGRSAQGRTERKERPQSIGIDYTANIGRAIFRRVYCSVNRTNSSESGPSDTSSIPVAAPCRAPRHRLPRCSAGRALACAFREWWRSLPDSTE